MIIATSLLQELKKDLELEIKEIQNTIENKPWENMRRLWVVNDAGLSDEAMDEWCKNARFEHLVNLKIAEDELLQVNMELAIISKIK